MSRNKFKARLIPEQDKRICGGICLCQLTVVLSCVALVYLTVAIYIPAHKAFHSGFDPTPVTCQSWNTTYVNNCSWVSCGEWCLTKTSGYCPQIHVTVRRNGTDVIFEDCSSISTVACPPANLNAMKEINCNNGSACSTLTGLFNCSLGHCANMSNMFQCRYKTEGGAIDSEKDNSKLNGFFECRHSNCVKVKRMKSCTRYCPKIGTTGANVYVGYEDSVITMQCKSIIATNECHGIEEGQVIDPETIWTAKPGEILLTSCGTITRNGTSLSATDCINGTLVGDADIPKPHINFTVYWNLLRNSTKVLDPSQRFMPPQWALTMYNNSDLFINLDGCVNTLQGECNQFVQIHGRDGSNETAQARFPCYYNKNDSSRVVARFDLVKVWKELLIAITIPSILFVISFITLCVITHSVKVGDDTKMRCKCCVGSHEPSTQVPLVKPELHKPKPRNKRNTETDDEQAEEETSINDDFQGINCPGGSIDEDQLSGDQMSGVNIRCTIVQKEK